MQRAIEKFGGIEKGGKPMKDSYSFDINGNKVRTIFFNSDGNLRRKLTYQYAKNGNLIKSSSFNKDGSLNYNLIYKYDENRNITSSSYYKPNGNLSYEYTHKYDANGNKKESFTYNSDRILWKQNTYKYDELGNEIECNWYKKDNTLDSKNIYKYNERGDIIETNSFNKNGSLKYRITYKFDLNGNEVESKFFNSDGSLKNHKVYKYNYDKNGNWIKRIEYNNSIAEFIEIREYQYYEKTKQVNRKGEPYPKTNKIPFKGLSKNEKINFILNEKVGSSWRLEKIGDFISDTYDISFIKEHKIKNPDFPFYAFGDFDNDGNQDMALKIIRNGISKIIFYNPYKDKIYWWKDKTDGAVIESITPSEVDSYDGEKSIIIQSDGLEVTYLEVSAYYIYWNGDEFSQIWISD